jgi:hypothetical protein
MAVGYAGGLVVAGLASWLRVAMTGTFRIDVYDVSFFVASGLLGVGLGIACFCAFRLTQVAEGFPRGHLVRWALAANLAVVFAAPLTSADLFTYLGLGRLQLLGENPFSVPLSRIDLGPLSGAIPARWAATVSPYGPVANAMFFAAAWTGALLRSPWWGSAVAFKLIMASCHSAFILLAARYSRKHRPGKDGARALALVAFCPLIAWEVSGEAHNDGFLIVALMLFVTAAVEGRALAAVLALAVATQTKVTLAPILLLYLLFLLRTKGARALLHALAALLLSALVMLPFLRGFTGFGGMASAIRSAARSHSIGDFLYNVLAPFGPRVQERAVTATLVLCIAVSAVAFQKALRANTVAELLRGALVFLLVWDMTVPPFETWYVTWLFPLAVAETDARWQKLVFVYGALSVLEWTGPVDPFSTMGVNLYVVWRMSKLLRAGGSEAPPAGLAASRAVSGA